MDVAYSVAQFHEGEKAVHSLMRVPPQENPTSTGLPRRYALRAAASPLMAVGALDSRRRPWVTVWGGERGEVCGLVGPEVLGIRGVVDTQYDPVLEALFGAKRGNGEVVQVQDEGVLMAALGIDLDTRDRVKLAGRFVAGAVEKAEQADPAGRVGEMQMAFHVTESIGNCPKYLNRKTIRAALPEPELLEELAEDETMVLGAEAIRVVEQADLFFLSSWDGKNSMDANHRGGSRGFVRIERGEDGKAKGLIWPEYSGNRLYQTLGNLHLLPKAGLVFPDFETGDVLYLTGITSILSSISASSLLPRAKLAVRFTPTAYKVVKSGLPFRATDLDPSPYNPPVWPLACEKAPRILATPNSKPTMKATLVSRDLLTPTVARFRFCLQGLPPDAVWKPGQHVTFDFKGELDMGYAHMRDDDPASLNDDFVRTFTISSVPPNREEIEAKGGRREVVEFEITARKHGPVTGLLFKHQVGRVELEVPVLGFGGEERFRIKTEETEGDAVFVAGGVGITPILAQAPGLLESRVGFEVLWSLRAEDLWLAVDYVEKINGLGDKMTIFVTGEHDQPNLGPQKEGNFSADQLLERLKGKAVKIERRRFERNDVIVKTLQTKRKYYCCTSPGLKEKLVSWLEGEESVWEDFGY